MSFISKILSCFNKYSLCIFAIPFLLIIVNRNVFFTPASYIDPWVYTGYFFSLPSHLQEFAGTYYGTRLPWIVPGFIIHSVFPAVLANYILHVGFYLVFLFTLFNTLKENLNSKTALLSVLITALSPAVVGAFGTDYIDGAGITYILLTLFFIEKASGNKFYIAHAFWLGFFAACMIFTNLFLIYLCPVLALHFIFRNFNPLIFKRLGLVVIFSAFGLILAALFWGIINRFFGGEFLFFKPSIAFALSFKGQVSPYMPSDWSWILRAYWLIFPLIAVIGSLIFLLRNVLLRRIRLDFHHIIQLDLLLSVVIFSYLQYVSHQAILSTHYYVSYLLPFTFLALSVQLFWDVTKLKGWFLIFCLFFLALMWSFVFHPLSAVHYLLYQNPFSAWFNELLPEMLLQVDFFRTLIALLLGIAMIFMILKIRRPLVKMLIICLSLSLMYSSVHRELYPGVLCQLEGKGKYSECFNLTEQVHRFLQDNLDDKEPRFWYDHRDPLCPRIFRAISSTYLWGYRLLNEDYPKITLEQAALLSSNKKLVILSSAGKEDLSYIEALHQVGFATVPVIVMEFGQGELAFKLQVFDLKWLHEKKMRDRFKNGSVVEIFKSSGNSLESFFQRNIYAGSAREAVKFEEGILFYVPTSNRDHLASPFYSVTEQSKPDRWIRVQLNFGASHVPENRTFVVVQDQAYNPLAEKASPFENSIVDIFVPLKEDTTSIRILFMGKKGKVCHLPESFSVFQLDENDK